MTLGIIIYSLVFVAFLVLIALAYTIWAAINIFLAERDMKKRSSESSALEIKQE